MYVQLFLAFCLTISLFQSNFAQDSNQSSQSTAKSPQKTEVDKEDVVRITTNLVQVDAVVTKDGKPVNNLKAEDFEIFEDGHRQTITSFAYISNVPETQARPQSTGPNGPTLTPRLQLNVPRRTIALVVDDLGMSAASIHAVKSQLAKFINEKIQPQDLVAIIRTGGPIGALQQFTNDRRLLNRALSQVRWNLCSRVGVSYFTPVGSRQIPTSSSLFGPCGGTASIGNTLRALRNIVEAMGELPGRKSMVFFSDSLPREEQEFDFDDSRAASAVSLLADRRDYSFLLQRIAEKAIRSTVVIYSIDAGGLQPTGPTAADTFSGSVRQINEQMNDLMRMRSQTIWDRREGADLIARETGGFLVRNSNGFQLDRILEDQSGYYLIGYRPAEETFDKRFHHIKAKVKRSGFSLRTRFGFYGFTEDEANHSKRAPADNATIALMSPFGAQDIELDLSAAFANDKTQGSVVRSFIYLNAKDLAFTDEADGWHKAMIEFRGVVFGNNGNVVNQVTYSQTLRLRAEAYEQALHEGLSLRFDVPVAKPGAYQIRVSARDLSSGHIGAVGQFVPVPDLRNHKLAVSGIVMRASDSNGKSEMEFASGPAIRHFKTGSTVLFALAIYNSVADATRPPNIVVEARLFREAKNVYTSPPMKVDLTGQVDLARILTEGFIHLDQSLLPGDYYLQLTVTDNNLNEKQEPAVQWIDFEIVK